MKRACSPLTFQVKRRTHSLLRRGWLPVKEWGDPMMELSHLLSQGSKLRQQHLSVASHCSGGSAGEGEGPVWPWRGSAVPSAAAVTTAGGVAGVFGIWPSGGTTLSPLSASMASPADGKAGHGAGAEDGAGAGMEGSSRAGGGVETRCSKAATLEIVAASVSCSWVTAARI